MNQYERVAGLSVLGFREGIDFVVEHDGSIKGKRRLPDDDTIAEAAKKLPKIEGTLKVGEPNDRLKG